MRLLVTGATGFIGAQIARRLVARGHHVVCLVRNPERAATLRALGAELVVGDLGDPRSVSAAISGCEQLVHSAALYSLWHPEVNEYHQVNVEGTETVMRVAAEQGLARALLMSTALVYGAPPDCPFDEDSKPGPRRFGSYVESKWQGEQRAWAIARQQRLPLVVLYPGAVLGPGDPHPTGRYITAFLNRRLPAAVFLESMNTYVDVGDVAEAVCLAVESSHPESRYLVGGHRLRYRELNLLLTEISGVPSPPLTIPAPLATLGAWVVTRAAGFLHSDPGWALSEDAIAIVRAGTCFDGSRATRQLGLQYTSFRRTLESLVQSWRGRART